VALPITYRNVTGTSDACVVALPIAYRNGTGTSDACFVAFMCVESVESRGKSYFNPVMVFI